MPWMGRGRIALGDDPGVTRVCGQAILKIPLFAKDRIATGGKAARASAGGVHNLHEARRFYSLAGWFGIGIEKTLPWQRPSTSHQAPTDHE